MDPEEVVFIHYQVMNHLSKMLEDLSSKIFMVEYHNKPLGLGDLYEIERSLKFVVDNFKPPHQALKSSTSEIPTLNKNYPGA